MAWSAFGKAYFTRTFGEQRTPMARLRSKSCKKWSFDPEISCQVGIAGQWCNDGQTQTQQKNSSIEEEKGAFRDNGSTISHPDCPLPYVEALRSWGYLAICPQIDSQLSQFSNWYQVLRRWQILSRYGSAARGDGIFGPWSGFISDRSWSD